MVKTIFDIANLAGGMWFWYFFFIVIIGVWADGKNRNGFTWAAAALFFSPLIVGIILLFSGKLDKKENTKETENFTCTNCNAERSKNSDFCPKCGVKFKEAGVKCPKCKVLNTKDDKFCSKCGYQLIEDPEKTFICEYCNKEFKVESKLESHYTHCIKRKHRKEKDKEIYSWSIPIMFTVMFTMLFWTANKINIIPTLLIFFVITPFFNKILDKYKKKNKKIKHFEFNWWKKGILIVGIILLFILINLIIPSCPKTCDDRDICTNDFCSSETGYKCMSTIKLNCNGNGICEAGEYGKSSDCPDCNDNNKCTADSYNTASKQCIHVEMTGCIQ